MNASNLFFVLLILVLALARAVHALDDCNAQIRSACAVTTIQTLVARARFDILNAAKPADVFDAITRSNQYRAPINFFVVVFDDQLMCLADGADPSNVGLSFKEIVKKNKVVTSFNLGEQFLQIAEFAQGGWVNYQYSPYDTCTACRAVAKRAYVLPFNTSEGVGFVAGTHDETDVDQQTAVCSARFWDRRSCSSSNAYNLVMTLAAALREPDAVVADVFNSVTNSNEFTLPPDFRVAVLTSSGAALAVSRRPELVGQAFPAVLGALVPGATNVAFVLNQYASQAAAGGGWISYEAAAGTRYDFVQQVQLNATSAVLVVSGFYANIECPNKADWTVCNAALRTPCALLSAQNLVFKVRNDMSQASSSAAFANVLSQITNTNTYKLPTGFYSFAYFLNTTNVAHGAVPANINKTVDQIVAANRLATSTRVGFQFSAAAIAGGGWIQYQWSNYRGTGGPTPLKAAFSLKAVDQETGLEYFCGSGFDLTDPDASTSACSNRFFDRRDCSTSNPVNVVGIAKALLAQADSDAALSVALGNVTNNLRVSDFQTFVFERSADACLAWTDRADFAGSGWAALLPQLQLQASASMHAELAELSKAAGWLARTDVNGTSWYFYVDAVAPAFAPTRIFYVGSYFRNVELVRAWCPSQSGHHKPNLKLILPLAICIPLVLLAVAVLVLFLFRQHFHFIVVPKSTNNEEWG